MNRVSGHGVLGLLFAGLLTASLAGCSNNSYPADKLKEYGIDNIDVKVAGSTIGVYLPLKKLFATDFKSSVVAGKVRNLETLFEPSPEALEKVEDVLFSISRVLLSTDKKLDFYVLQATDTENTGLQLVLVGHVGDVKRVRVWDISRTEYRKRVIHEMRQNRAVLWHQPIRSLFASMETKPVDLIMQEFFDDSISAENLQGIFFHTLHEKDKTKPVVKWNIEEIRSARVQRGEVLVYTKVRPTVNGNTLLAANEGSAQFLFLVGFKGTAEPQIKRIIPFQYLDETGKFQNIPFPEDIQMEQSLETWEEEFPLEEMHLGDFLADQLTRRVQVMISQDERIRNTFREVRVTVDYDKESETPHFVFQFDSVSLRDFNNYSPESLILHEDMIYLLNMISREFVDVLRSYQFGDYEYLSVNISHEPGEHIIPRADLELFRQKKVDFQGLISVTTL